MTCVHELVEAWTNKKGRLLITVTALSYAAVLIPFNQAHWVVAGIPVRPAAALPVLFGILWGPAAAWGCGIGNIAGDIFGSWSPMSIFGFLVNFLIPYLSYLAWHCLMQGRAIRVGYGSLTRFFLVTFGVNLAGMAFLAMCGTLIFSRPFWSKFEGYFGNSIIWALTVGPLLFLLVLEPAVQRGLVYGRKWTGRAMTIGRPL